MILSTPRRGFAHLSSNRIMSTWDQSSPVKVPRGTADIAMPPPPPQGQVRGPTVEIIETLGLGSHAVCHLASIGIGTLGHNTLPSSSGAAMASPPSRSTFGGGAALHGYGSALGSYNTNLFGCSISSCAASCPTRFCV